MDKFSKLLKVAEEYSDPFEAEGGGPGKGEQMPITPSKSPYAVHITDLIHQLEAVNSEQTLTIRTWQDRGRISTFRVFEVLRLPSTSNDGRCQLDADPNIDHAPLYEFERLPFIKHLEAERSAGLREIRFEDTAGDRLIWGTLDRSTGVIWLDYLDVNLA